MYESGNLVHTEQFIPVGLGKNAMYEARVFLKNLRASDANNQETREMAEELRARLEAAEKIANAGNPNPKEPFFSYDGILVKDYASVISELNAFLVG